MLGKRANMGSLELAPLAPDRMEMPRQETTRAEPQVGEGEVVRAAEDFLKTVVAFPTVRAGGEPELLLEAMDRLCAELGGTEGTYELLGAGSALSGGERRSELLSPDEEDLVASMRQGLARIAAAAGAGRRHDARRAVSAALDGAELVIRGTLTSGKVAELAPLTPSFVFLVTLPVLGQDEALEISRRTSELIEAALRGY